MRLAMENKYPQKIAQMAMYAATRKFMFFMPSPAARLRRNFF